MGACKVFLSREDIRNGTFHRLLKVCLKKDRIDMQHGLERLDLQTKANFIFKPKSQRMQTGSISAPQLRTILNGYPKSRKTTLRITRLLTLWSYEKKWPKNMQRQWGLCPMQLKKTTLPIAYNV